LVEADGSTATPCAGADYLPSWIPWARFDPAGQAGRRTGVPPLAEPHLERIHEDAVTRRNDLIQLEQIAGGYPSVALPHRLTRPSRRYERPGENAPSRRGLPDSFDDSFGQGSEWKSVFVLNAVDGCIPSDLGVGTAAEVEERRLLYVAMTRAKNDLHLVVPQRFYAHGQRRRRQMSPHAPFRMTSCLSSRKWRGRSLEPQAVNLQSGNSRRCSRLCSACGGSELSWAGIAYR
jgi:hypothetical protein